MDTDSLIDYGQSLFWAIDYGQFRRELKFNGYNGTEFNALDAIQCNWPRIKNQNEWQVTGTDNGLKFNEIQLSCSEVQWNYYKDSVMKSKEMIAKRIREFCLHMKLFDWQDLLILANFAVLTLAVPEMLCVSGDVTLICSDVINPIANPQTPPTINAVQNHGSNKWM